MNSAIFDKKKDIEDKEEMMDLKKTIGFENQESVMDSPDDLVRIINLKLFSTGLPTYEKMELPELYEAASSLVIKFKEKSRLLSNYLCPVDRRIQNFIDKSFKDTDLDGKVKVPATTFHLDRHGLARGVSLPPDKNSFESEYVSSHRVLQGVLHNPRSDRRTTKNTFHIAEGGPLIQADKVAIPKYVFGRLLEEAFRPPKSLMELPFTSTQSKKAKTFTSMYLRPIVSPEVAGVSSARSMEIRFFAPGGLVSNLDFVESIFGNAGDPYLPKNDAALDVEGFTGHTGCVILAPHLPLLTKKELGLPEYKDATERQRLQGVCWKKADEKYNEGKPFKAVLRTEEGQIITLLGDNYFGYCKKEVKTQIGFSANLLGLAEEEHSGGALVFPSYSLGDHFKERQSMADLGHSFSEVIQNFSGLMKLKPEGYGIDKKYSSIKYVPESAVFDLHQQKICWKNGEQAVSIKLLPNETYFHPSGYKVKMEKHPGAPSWRLIGTAAEGTLCHKPCTVSGGGKSEISKSLEDSILYHSLYIHDLETDLDKVEEIINKDYGNRFREKIEKKAPTRSLLSPERSLGSVIQLLTPSPEFTDTYNSWLNRIPNNVRSLVNAVKRFYRLDWEENWRKHFTVDIIDGVPGHELIFEHRKLIASYLRVGRDLQKKWRTYRLRIDYMPAEKLQVEDDITSSITLPVESLEGLNPMYKHPSVKFVANSEYRLFQRPDDAKFKGFDKQAEIDLSKKNSFISNFEPLNSLTVKELMDNTIEFEKYTEPMKEVFRKGVTGEKGDFIISSAHPRLVEGKPTPNVRYLQDRPDLCDPQKKYIAEMGMRLSRNVKPENPLYTPVNAVLIGRRNNPANYEEKILPLSVYSPLHYQPLPELFMDFISSLTGKSPSTTGAGSEGALTKGPFNALCTVIDLNNALTSYILTGYQVFSTPAGHIGSQYKVDHDISLLIPELWARLSEEERDADWLIKNKFMSPVKDFTYEGRKVLGSRLGYRINENFTRKFLGRVFANPMAVFPEDILSPEQQSQKDFALGIENITEAHQRIAQSLIDDGSVKQACPPIEGLIYIMAKGEWNGLTLGSSEFRELFTRKNLLASKWYQKRLLAKQQKDLKLWEGHRHYLKDFAENPQNKSLLKELDLKTKIAKVEEELTRLNSPALLDSLKGTIGLDSFL